MYQTHSSYPSDFPDKCRANAIFKKWLINCEHPYFDVSNPQTFHYLFGFSFILLSNSGWLELQIKTRKERIAKRIYTENPSGPKMSQDDKSESVIYKKIGK